MLCSMSRRKRFVTKIILAALVLAMIPTVSWLIGRHYVYASMGYSMFDHFSQMPSDDNQLVAWLKQQPGVVEHTVHVERQGDSLHVIFIQVRNMARHPSLPLLDERVIQLGYQGGQGFRDE